MVRGDTAEDALDVMQRTHNPPVLGSSPSRPTGEDFLSGKALRLSGHGLVTCFRACAFAMRQHAVTVGQSRQAAPHQLRCLGPALECMPPLIRRGSVLG